MTTIIHRRWANGKITPALEQFNKREEEQQLGGAEEKGAAEEDQEEKMAEKMVVKDRSCLLLHTDQKNIKDLFPSELLSLRNLTSCSSRHKFLNPVRPDQISEHHEDLVSLPSRSGSDRHCQARCLRGG